LIRFLCLIIFLLVLTTVEAQVITDSTVPVRVDTIVKQDTPPPRIIKQNSPIAPPPLPVPDSLKTDTIQQSADSVAMVTSRDSLSMRPLLGGWWKVSGDSPFFTQILYRHPFFDFASSPLIIHSDLRRVQGKETFFYVIAGIVFVFALLKQAFGKYFNDLFRVFFRTTMKQRQIREQLMQTPLPSLVFNIFFVGSAGLYIDFLLQYFKLTPVDNFWLLYLYCCIGLALIYFGKFIGLKIVGWLFNMKKAADSYIFIVFIINKVIGIFLLPFLVILAFAGEPVYSSALVLSWCGIGVLLLYRFILGYGAIRNEVRFNLFHFFLYLCAFEITPLLLIYKLLLLVF
jgi:hypothetical protein